MNDPITLGDVLTWLGGGLLTIVIVVIVLFILGAVAGVFNDWSK